MTNYSWVVKFINHGQSSSLKASFEIKLGPLDVNMVSESPLECWVDLPPYCGPRVWLVSFEIELGRLDFNKDLGTRFKAM